MTQTIDAFSPQRFQTMCQMAEKGRYKVFTSDESDLSRFEKHVQINPITGCWEWQAKVAKDGYGSFSIGSRTDGSRTSVTAHRWAYGFWNGPLDPNMQIDHLCRNRKCCNPAHLEQVTSQENVLRGNAPTALNAKKTHCPAGHPYNEENTFVNKKGSRCCRTCNRRNARKQKGKKA